MGYSVRRYPIGYHDILKQIEPHDSQTGYYGKNTHILCDLHARYGMDGNIFI